VTFAQTFTIVDGSQVRCGFRLGRVYRLQAGCRVVVILSKRLDICRIIDGPTLKTLLLTSHVETDETSTKNVIALWIKVFASAVVIAVFEAGFLASDDDVALRIARVAIVRATVEGRAPVSHGVLWCFAWVEIVAHEARESQQLILHGFTVWSLTPNCVFGPMAALAPPTYVQR
jgi:hypothetical protein